MRILVLAFDTQNKQKLASLLMALLYLVQFKSNYMCSYLALIIGCVQHYPKCLYFV